MTQAFDAKLSQRVERLYQTPDMVEQRRASRALLMLRPGERVLDIGCGPGLLALEMAREVGADGHVTGIDVSRDMLALARPRCAAAPNITLMDAGASALPFDDASFDVVASTQVYEFVADIEAALRELKRVMKPGARALIVDTDWDALLWNNSDRARMRRIIDAWHAHVPHPHLPGQLPRLLRAAGLRLVGTTTIPLINSAYDEDTYSHGMITNIGKYVASKGIGVQEVEQWAADFAQLGARGEYFFCVSRVAFVAAKV